MINKISHKLILTVAIVSIAIIGIFSYLIVTSHHRALISQVEHSAHQLSETIKSSTKYDMLLNHRDRVHRIIDTVGRQEGIEKVRVFNKDGSIIYSQDKTVIGSMVDKEAEACYACHAADSPLEQLSIPERTRIFAAADGGRNLGIINPIYNEPSCWQADCHAHDSTQKVLGVLDVTMSLTEVDHQMVAGRTKVFLLTTTAIVFISFIIWLFFRRLVGHPVNELVKATDSVAAGDLTYRLPVRRNDELGQLGESFNEMTRRLGEAQRQIYQSDKLASLGRLAAGIAHEINNPLTGVLTYSSFLLKRAEKDSEAHDDLETIVRETKRCREIVKSLLDFSRRVPAKLSNIDVIQVIDRALKIVHNQLSFHNIHVSRHDQDALPSIRADENQLLQVFINLLVNAADAVGEGGGEITLSTRPARNDERQWIEIEVSDTGPGIPPEDLGKIFDPFYTTKEDRGTGLGLSVAWGILERHRGTISVDSDVGKGTTFTIRLPVNDESLVMGP